MRFGAIVVVMALAAPSVAAQDPTACELVDQASAEVVLGSGARNLADAEGSCRYDAADGSLVMMILIQPLVLYDVSPINPATPIDIGGRGRYGVGSSGSANVQFAKGQSSVTIRVTPMEGRGPAGDLMDAVLEIARIAADRMELIPWDFLGDLRNRAVRDRPRSRLPPVVDFTGPPASVRSG